MDKVHFSKKFHNYNIFLFVNDGILDRTSINNDATWTTYMAIKVSWYNNQQALLYTFPTEWTWEDLENVQDDANRLLDSLNYSVPIICDMTQSKGAPLGALGQSKARIRRVHPNTTTLVIVGANPIITALLHVVNKLIPASAQKLATAPDLESAFKLGLNRP